MVKKMITQLLTANDQVQSSGMLDPLLYLFYEFCYPQQLIQSNKLCLLSNSPSVPKIVGCCQVKRGLAWT